LSLCASEEGPGDTGRLDTFGGGGAGEEAGQPDTLSVCASEEGQGDTGRLDTWGGGAGEGRGRTPCQCVQVKRGRESPDN